ncbi:MAG: TrkH family potassium uptake protein, partial [Bacteroidia bacterium]|nr:TrkH family potassium uptake protein [Bacteroidia bacterium]
MKLNLKIIIHFFGLLLLFNGAFMLLSSLVSSIYNDEVTLEIFKAGVTVLIIGGIFMIVSLKHKKEMNKREGYIVVTFGWIIMALSGTLPYMFTGVIPNFTNAFFETISGYTTTGATILTDIESLPKGILFWRSLTHWIGGMGIIVLAIAILPLLGIGGMELFAAEAPGPSADKLHPRITDTAKRLWLIYFGYTAAETVLLQVAGMNFFDAINHSMCTLSTGGFSTKNASLAHYNSQPIIQYIIIVFM